MRVAGLDAFACVTDHSGHCITCSDEGVPMTVLAVDEASDLATCQDGTGTQCVVDVGLLGPVAPGTTLLSHAGVAIACLDGGGA